MREEREGQEEKCETILVCGVATRQDCPQRLHTAWNHPQSLAGFFLMGSRASKGTQRLPSSLGRSSISMDNSS